MSLTLKEQEILAKIHVGSENDPAQPEYPPYAPMFPATTTTRLHVPGFTNLWIKNENENLTGTHKDRMAWEIIVTYRNLLISKQRGVLEYLPAMSIISSGSAAVAIQNLLSAYELPALRVLVDFRLDPRIYQSLKKTGCLIYQTDLSTKPLSSTEILELTDNQQGFDITSSDALDPSTRFYDWLSYEILNNNPEYCFIPFGTGHLYENILNVAKKEVLGRSHDPRFSGSIEIVRNCNFYGATTNNAQSKANKLYSPHLPFARFDQQWIRTYRAAGFCGVKSDVHLVEEVFIDQALSLAQVQGIQGEASGLAGLALLLQFQDLIPKNSKIVIVNTGKTKLVDYDE
ncbi:pyridoxal-phosphate dependent enzyme [bacterium]|nr:pyridoxal-phosphate dependent enzyme [bacterium]